MSDNKIINKICLINYISKVMNKSLYISTIIAPSLLFPINLYYSNYDTLFTSLLVSFISILYHHKYNIKYIRYIDITISTLILYQHFYIARNFTKKKFIPKMFLKVPLFYFISHIFNYLDKKNVSNTIHAFMHLYVVWGNYYLNKYRIKI